MEHDVIISVAAATELSSGTTAPISSYSEIRYYMSSAAVSHRLREAGRNSISIGAASDRLTYSGEESDVRTVTS